MSDLSRRSFLARAAAAGIAASARYSVLSYAQNRSEAKPADMQLNALALPAFADPLLLPETLHPSAGKLSITMREIRAPLHRNLPPARLWTYGSGDGRRGAVSGGAMSPVIELQAGQAAQIEWINLLPRKHIFPIDHTLHGCGRELPEVRTVTHLHGAHTRARDDGYPESWFVYGQSRVCRYPMRQDATALWYHDHAMGLNRLNIYAGLAGMVLLRDDAEGALGLPRGAYEVPLILYDRMLRPSGELLYPTSGDPVHPWVPEFFGDALCVNGRVRPYFEAEPVLYRFRVLNAANSRFYTLSLTGGRTFHQIGSDQGLLAAPTPIEKLVLAPSERADLLIDFHDLAGRQVCLLTGVQEMLQFRVAARRSPAGPQSRPPAALRSVERMNPADAVTTRRITLHEYDDEAGQPAVMLLNRKRWHEAVTEIVRLNTTEIWEFVNLTEDTHPMHLHAVRFQILDRRAFDQFAYLMYGRLQYMGEAATPPAQELGWKDVVQCPAKMVTRIMVRFEGFSGRYLYHCHILEHEANEMMRPLEIVDARRT